jgi:hypothetical protein
LPSATLPYFLFVIYGDITLISFRASKRIIFLPKAAVLAFTEEVHKKLLKKTYSVTLT